MTMTTKKEDERNGKLSRIMTNCLIRAAEGEGNRNKFHLSFSSEEPYERWWGTEILSHEEGAVNLDRLNSIGVILFNHKSDAVIGRIEKAWIEDNRGEADIVFDDDDYMSFVRSKVESGTLKGVSVGYVVNRWEDIDNGHTSSDGFEGPCSIARAWTPLEISIVSVPADPTVGVGRAHEGMPESIPETKGVSSFYFIEKQLQINKNRR